jgi:hypothetical protein
MLASIWSHTHHRFVAPGLDEPEAALPKPVGDRVAGGLGPARLVRVVGQLGEPWLGQRLGVQRGHYTMLQPSQVSRLAAVLRDVLGD